MNKLSLLFTVFTGLANASTAQISFAPEAGLNMATMAMKVTDLAGGSFVYKTSFKAGVAAGAVVDIRLAKSIYFQPGLFYEMTGTKFTADYNHAGGEWDINTFTLPLNFEYETGEEGGNRFFAGLGPYVAYNVSGNNIYEANQTYGYGSGTANLLIGSAVGTDYIKALDLGAGINVAYKLSGGFYARAHYQQGLSNLSPFADAHDAYKTSAAGVTIGYYIGGRKSKKGWAEHK